jgi:hypothetical protein
VSRVKCVLHSNFYLIRVIKFHLEVLPPSQIILHIIFSQSQTLISLIKYIAKFINFYNIKLVLLQSS